MQKIFVYIGLALAIGSGSALACPEFNGVDLAGDYSSRPQPYEELSSQDIVLTESEFYSVPVWSGGRRHHLYERCKDVLVLTTLKHKETGRIFKSITSHEDMCDGGNSFGALFTENLILRVADIGDSFISCYE